MPTLQKRICKMDGCEDPARARGLCQRHYCQAYRAGTLSGHPLGTEHIDPTWHRLSNIDAATKTGDCSVCGPRVRVDIRTDGKGSQCWSLVAARRRRANLKHGKKYMKKYIEKMGPRSRKDQYLRSKYKITITQYEQMVQEQAGRCLICKNQPKVLVVDHCHETGRVRGLLCSSCNAALGLLKEDPDGIKGAAAYLVESSRANVA